LKAKAESEAAEAARKRAEEEEIAAKVESLSFSNLIISTVITSD
jgi:hypothetical protein